MNDMIQGSPEWKAARCGKVTASRVADLMAKTKTGWGASRGNYMAELIAERLTGVAAEGFTNAAMQWGTATEPLARDAYSFRQDVDVGEVGFVDHFAIPMTGASPDGLVGDLGLIEIKCPNTATHIETLISQTIPGKYETQMLWQMACTDTAWCDFVSFDPRMPADLQLFVKRFHADSARITELETEVKAFLTELDAKVEQLRALNRRSAA